MSFKYRLLILIAILFSVTANAQSLKQNVDRLLSSYSKKGQFDGSILISRKANIIFSKSYGLANRQFKVPVSSSTKFPIGSISKLYTAIIILKLQEEGKLNIDSPVYSYIPNILPRSGKLVTLKELLTHTSGLPNEKITAYQKPYSVQDFIKFNIADTLLSKPGAGYNYNNVNYILLGAVIEAVTKEKWQNVLFKTIIHPLNLKNTGVVKTDSIITNLAYGYHNYAFGDLPARPLQNDGFIYMENYATAGAVFTTPIDLFKLHLAVSKNKILSATSVKLMYSPETQLGKVDDTDYFVTLGSYFGQRLFKGQKHPVRIIERSGNINGFNATYIQLPAYKETVIIFCNTDAGDLDKISNEVVAELISKP